MVVFNNRVSGRVEEIGGMSAGYPGGTSSSQHNANHGYAAHTANTYASKATDNQIARSKTTRSKVGKALRGADKQAAVDRRKGEAKASKDTYGH